MWHKIAPRLAEEFSAVATDLRGYGESGKPPSESDHAPYAVRAAYREAFRDPETIHAICEEYRAAATLDYQHDEADRERG